jgi:hypothetical protein
MRIEQQIRINDEPWVAEDNGIRTATLVYTGPRYIYLEYDTVTGKIQQLAHISESEPDIEGALEKLSPFEDRAMAEVDSRERIIVASHFWHGYELKVEDYVEELENGETYTYAYHSPDAKLGEIFDFNNMVWNQEKNDFAEYKFYANPVTQEDMIESIEMILEKVQDSLDTDTGITNETREIITAYKTALIKFKSDMALGVECWKMAFPICSVPY